MPVTPAWQASSSGYPANAGTVNQLLGTHAATFMYASPSVLSGGGSGSGLYQSTAPLWLAAPFTASADATALALQLSAVGGSPVSSLIPPLAIGIYADGTTEGSPGPYGTAVASGTLPGEYVYSSGYWVQCYPLLSGLTAGTTYWLATSPAGTGSNYYAWQEAASGPAAMTAPDGVTWTAASFSLLLEVLGSGSYGPPVMIAEDGGARITSLAYTSGLLTGISEWTVAQSGGPGLAQSRTVTYNSGFPIGVS